MKKFVISLAFLCILLNCVSSAPTIGEFLAGYANYSSSYKSQYIPSAYVNEIDKIAGFFAQSSLVSSSMLGDASGSFTVFLPIDSAVSSVISSGPGITNNILAYHVLNEFLNDNVGGNVDMVVNSTAVHPNWIRINTYFINDYLFNGFISSLATSISFSNGIVYIIDNVLIPPCIASEILVSGCQNSLVDAPVTADLEYDSTISDFMQLIDASGITLPNPVTLFVPLDTYFSYPPNLIQYIKSNASLLQALVQWHVVSGLYFPGYAQASGTSLMTVGGNIVDFTTDGTTQLYVGYGSQIVTISSSMRTRTDGIIYTIYPSLYPYPLPTTLPPFTPTNPVTPVHTPSGSDRNMWSFVAFGFVALFLMNTKF